MPFFLPIMAKENYTGETTPRYEVLPTAQDKIHAYIMCCKNTWTQRKFHYIVLHNCTNSAILCH